MGGGQQSAQEITSIEEDQDNNSNNSNQENEAQGNEAQGNENQENNLDGSDTDSSEDKDTDASKDDQDNSDDKDNSDKGDSNKDDSDTGNAGEDSKNDQETDKDETTDKTGESDDLEDHDTGDKKDVENAEDKEPSTDEEDPSDPDAADKAADEVKPDEEAKTGEEEKKDDLEEAEKECAHLAGCVNGEHDENCPCNEEYDEDCAHLEGCTGGLHDKDCPLYEEVLPVLPALLTAQTEGNTYEVGSGEDDLSLSGAFEAIESSDADEAVIILNDNVTIPAENAISTLGVAGAHITFESKDNESYTIVFYGYGILAGPCTFENVKVSGRRLFCNGYETIFTEESEIYLSETLYGGGYKETVDSTYVVLAGDGEINPVSSSGLHDVIGGSYQASVEGDTYLEITGNIAMQDGNHLNPGCVMGDGTSGDGKNSPDVYVGGDATLIYDNENAKASPAIEGSYGCEMQGNVTLEVRSGRANEICGTQEYAEKSIIRGDLHIIAGSEEYEDTDRTLRLNGNWPIVGAGNSFAESPFETGVYEVDGDITIDVYENVWGWDKGTDPSYDIPEIYGAIDSKVGGSITINVNGAHMENITGEWDSTIEGNVTIHAVDVELKNSYYETEYDEGDIIARYYGSVKGTLTVDIDGGDVNIIRLTNYKTVTDGSSISITGSPKIRTGVISTANYSGAPETAPQVQLFNCFGTIPFIQSASAVTVTDNSDVTVNGLWLVRDLYVEEGSSLKSNDLGWVELEGNAVIDGTWEQLYTADNTDDFDCKVDGTMTVGSEGTYISRGTMNVAGNVENSGIMALMKPAQFDSDYQGHDGKLRLPAVDENNYTGAETPKIPLRIKGISSGTTTAETVETADWQTLKAPVLQDNYIVSVKSGEDPIQSVFLLGNEDALEAGLYLKRLDDPGNSSINYMWQVAKGISVIFDKNGGDTDASPKIETKDLVNGQTYYNFDLPATEPTKSGCKFTGWNTAPDGSGNPFTAATKVTQSMRVYAQWEAGYATVTPMDVTIYTGGEGYYGVIGSDDTFIFNDFPEIGYYFTLPDEINHIIQNSLDDPIDLSEKLVMTYDDGNGTTRKWEIELYGEEKHSKTMVNGRHCYIYKLLPSQIDGTDEMVPLRIQYTDESGNVMNDSDFQISDMDQYRDYAINFFTGDLDPDHMRIEITSNGRTYSYKVMLGTGSLKIRGNVNNHYAKIEYGTPTVNPENPHLMLASAMQKDTTYYINDSGIKVMDISGVRLFVDESVDDDYLENYINQNKNAEGKYVCQARYLDLVDTQNGNVYLKMAAGQKMNIYWPVPEDAKADSEFHMVHFKAFHREHDGDMDALLEANPPEEHPCEKVTISGQEFLKFTVESFSPFVLLYEQDAAVDPGTGGNGSGSNGGHSGSHSSGSGSIDTNVTQQETVVDPKQTAEGQTEDPAVDAEETGIKEEDQMMQDLPKTGQKEEYSLFTLLFSGLMLGLMLTRKKKEQ